MQINMPSIYGRRRIGVARKNERKPLAHSVPHFLFAGMIWLAVIMLLGWLQQRDLEDRQAVQTCSQSERT